MMHKPCIIMPANILEGESSDMTRTTSPDPMAGFARHGTPPTAARDDRGHLPGGQAAQLLAGATWISYPETETPPAGERPAYAFRKAFRLAAVPAESSLHVTAHGLYEAFVNGARVGAEELTPGFTSYHTTLYVQTFDVAALLRPGDNELRLLLSDGWFRGRHGYQRVPDHFGERTAVVARLVAGDTTVVTDPSWQAGVSEIVRADLMDGQTADLRRIDRQEWSAAVASDDLLCTDATRLGFSPAPPVRRTEEYPAVSVTRLASGRQIVDFGTMVSGWVRLSDLGPAGTTTTLTHGEHLDAGGDLTTDHLAAVSHRDQARLPVGQVDVVVSRGEPADVFEPRHTTHGFRYLAVDGRADDLAPAVLTAVLVRTDLRTTGWFECSDEDLNRLHEIAVQTWKANSCEVPTDCPTRERYGYTGDFQIYARTAAYLEDVTGFGRKWLRSLADDQFDSGCIPKIAPVAGEDDSRPYRFDGSAGWGDAATIVPWELYLASGDPSLLADTWEMMRRWVDWAADGAAGFRHPERAAARPEPLPHERYLWDSGFHFGEWLEPGGTFDPRTDPGIVATAYLARSARIVADVARVLGDQGAAAQYAALADRAADAWRIEYWRDESWRDESWRGGRLTIETQATYTRGLAFGLIPPADVPRAVDRLVALVHDADDHVGTGFLSTPLLLPVLADHGHADLAYKILRAEGTPGWMVMLRRGATAVWESWDGIDADGHATDSLDHYSKGAVISFLHKHAAGLRNLAPGWRRFRVEPVPGGGLTRAATAHDSPHGRIEVAWRLDGPAFQLDVTVPEGTTAEIVLPDSTTFEAGPGHHTRFMIKENHVDRR